MSAFGGKADIADSYVTVRLQPASVPLRTEERNFAARSKSMREHYASNHEGKRNTDKSKSKAVFGMLTIGFLIRALVHVRLLEQ
jgi:hypothetical protein